MTGDLKLNRCPALVSTQVIKGKWKTRVLWVLRHLNRLRERISNFINETAIAL